MANKTLFYLFWVLMLSGCHRQAPVNPDDICAIFEEKQNWYISALTVQEKWGIPVHIPMAIMYQESAFKFDAKPPMTYFLGIIPTGRSTSAFGFSQAKVATWLDYVEQTGNSWSSREDFDDAIDFMGWYLDKAANLNQISKSDAYNQYLSYHEGWTGYKNKSYIKKKWLLNVSKKVAQRAQRYQAQFKKCQTNLEHQRLSFF